MGLSNSLELIESCVNCAFRTERLFCDLPDDALKAFDAVKCTNLYPRRAILFAEGQISRGVFVLCKGRVRLSTALSRGRSLTVRLADPGEVLGLSATLSGAPYEVTAETIEPCHVNYIRQDDFLQLLANFPAACWRIVYHLNSYYYAAYEQIRSIAIPQTASERLAKLLLKWSHEGGTDTDQGIALNLPLTHEEIAQMIGTSRETVTRLLGEFKARDLLGVSGTNLVVKNKAALEAVGRN